jgi:hypothetical protein
MTGFTVTDAVDLEDKEGPISDKTVAWITSYRKLTTISSVLKDGESQCHVPS